MKKNRREFMTAAAAAVGTTLPAAASVAQPPATDALAASAKALAGIVRARWGKHLTEEQLRAIEQSIAGDLAGAELMKRVPLENGDEPDFAFEA